MTRSMHSKTQSQMFNTGVETFHQFVSFDEQNRFKSEQKVRLAQSHFSGKHLDGSSELFRTLLGSVFTSSIDSNDWDSDFTVL
jgi:hypothetical protein